MEYKHKLASMHLTSLQDGLKVANDMKEYMWDKKP